MAVHPANPHLLGCPIIQPSQKSARMQKLELVVQADRLKAQQKPQDFTGLKVPRKAMIDSFRP